MAQFNIINKAEKVVSYTFQITERSPKKLRCDIVPKLRETACSIMEFIIEANQYEITKEEFIIRKELQRKALIKIRLLEAFAEICSNNNYITKNQLDILVNETFELYQMIKNWIESDNSRLKV